MPRITLLATTINAKAYLDSFMASTTSREKAEKVVNPPRKPASMYGVRLCSRPAKPISSPATKLPIEFTVKVASGNG